MKVTYSVLVSSMSGTSANVVASKWKGINYVRQHVIPHNPQTTAQTAVRDALARCVTLWRSLSIVIKGWLDTYGVDYKMSGFNVFMSKSRTLEQAASLIKPVPDNPYCPAVSAFAPVTGIGASGDIDLTWTDNAPTAFDSLVVLARKSDANVFDSITGFAASTESGTLTGLTADEDYDVYGMFFNSTDNDHGTSTGTLDVKTKA